MDSTAVARTTRWRERTMCKARWFDAHESLRRRGLRFNAEDTRPEYLALRRYLTNYPGAYSAPDCVGFDAHLGCWVLVFPSGHREADVAAAAAAMLEATSVRVVVEVLGDGHSAQYEAAEVAGVDAVQRDVAELRRLGLWEA